MTEGASPPAAGGRTWRQYVVVLLAAVVISFLVVAFSGVRYLGDGVFLRVPRVQHDFGVVHSGALVNHRFTVLNLGSRPLAVGGLQFSCGCMSGDVPSALAPYKTTDVVVALDTAGIKKLGRVNQSVALVLPGKKGLLFRVTADVQEGVEFSAPRIEGAAAELADGRDLVVSRVGMPAEMFSRLEMKTTSPLIQVSSTSRSPDRHAWRCTVDARSAQRGTVGYVELVQSGDSRVLKRAPVIVQGTDGIQIVPARYVASLPPSGDLREQTERQFAFKNLESPVEVRKVVAQDQSPPRYFEWSADGDKLKIWVSAVPAESSLVYRTTLLIFLVDNERQQELVMPLPVRLLLNEG